MQNYHNLITKVLDAGIERPNRTNTNAISSFGHSLEFSLQNGFPLLTTKEIHIRSVLYELLWMIKGGTNIRYLVENGVSIWNEWADNEGNLGKTYGYQLRNWEGKIDQLKNLIEGLTKDPYGRRHIFSLWNPAEINDTALPPCHILAQFYISNNKLSCCVYQRSADIFLGVPFDIALYAALTELIAHQLSLKTDQLIWHGGDCHIYVNHLEPCKILLSRSHYQAPKFLIKTKKLYLWDYEYEDLAVLNYFFHPKIKAPVAI